MCTRLGLLHMGTSWCVLTGGSGNTHDRPPSERKKGARTFQHWIPQVLGGSRGCLHLRTIQMAPLNFPFQVHLNRINNIQNAKFTKEEYPREKEARY